MVSAAGGDSKTSKSGGSLGAGSTPGGAASSALASVPPPRDTPHGDEDLRAPSTVSIVLTDALVHRGLPFHVRGSVRADNGPCAHVTVELSLREPSARKRIHLATFATLATGDDGTFEGAVVPPGVPLGDYELSAETPGDARCGPGQN